MRPVYQATDNEIIFETLIQANASKNNISHFNGVLKIHISKPAVDGKANAEIIKFLSSFFSIRKSAVTIIKGEKSRHKKIKLNGINEKDFLDRINALF